MLNHNFFLALLFISLSVSGLQVEAGNDPPASGARSAALGGAYTAVSGDVWTQFFNPSGIAGIKSAQVGVFGEQRYLLNALNTAGLAISLPLGDKQAVGLTARTFGYSAYRENFVGLQYARVFYESFRLGVSLNAANTAVEGYGSATTFTADIGLGLTVSQKVSIGARVYNANQAKLGESIRTTIPTVISGGVAYKPSEKVLLTADASKHLDFPVSFRGGMEYRFVKAFAARAGVSTQPLTINAGFGINFAGLSIDISNGWHERLGYTPTFGLGWKFNQDKE